MKINKDKPPGGKSQEYNPSSNLDQVLKDIEAGSFDSLKDIINEMYSRDQETRKSNKLDPSVDIENTKVVKMVVDKMGWPKVSHIGEEHAKGFWILVQHADRDRGFQEKCLNLMKDLPDSEVVKKNMAYLEDRVEFGKGEPQIYGTQFIWSEETGSYVPYTIKDPASVNLLRAEMGMESIEENTERMNNLK